MGLGVGVGMDQPGERVCSLRVVMVCALVLGATGVPVILVGKKRMNGFSVKGFQRIYQ